VAKITVAGLVDFPEEKLGSAMPDLVRSLQEVARKHDGSFREVYESREAGCAGQAPTTRVAGNRQMFNWNDLPDDF